MENITWITRYNAPSKFVKAPYASIVKVINDTSGEVATYDLFIQVSPDEENPEWLTMGDFLTKVLEFKLHDSHYINELLGLFNEIKNK